MILALDVADLLSNAIVIMKKQTLSLELSLKGL